VRFDQLHNELRPEPQAGPDQRGEVRRSTLCNGLRVLRCCRQRVVFASAYAVLASLVGAR
jgi:hypothetical protein